MVRPPIQPEKCGLKLKVVLKQRGICIEAKKTAETGEEPTCPQTILWKKTFQGHSRSNVMVPLDSLYMISY